ncbi:hypothetical protein [Verrucomicrobium spinosum]|uniref:hypothetical protein n=1 Tax=Verrucomicrobium spinosum TaxID=2736 RepID=UPI0001745C2A|nr:hypothetical protein [Verrucomicrobium spinosum]
MRRFALYAFVITLLWLGFVCAISFVEAPLKFKAPGVELKHALSIGRLVFHALNRVELICCAFSWFLMLRLRVVRTRGSVVLLAVITAVLAFQVWGLMPVLDVRAKAVLAGEIVAASWHHNAYIGLEFLKAALLGVLAAAQIQSFARAVLSE